MCSTAKAGALVTPAPPMRDDPAGMARLGTVGYVDPYAGLQRVPADAVSYAFTGRSKGYMTYMTGTNMQSCRPFLRYNDMVTLGAGNKAARLQKDGTVLFEATATSFALRPPPGSDRMTGQLRYGDSVVLTQTITASDVSCGVYGCGVGKVVRGRFEVGPGGQLGGTPLTLEAPPGYESGPIRYGAPVLLSARLPPSGQVLTVGQSLRPRRALESPSKTYRLVYNRDGTAGVYSSDQRTIWVTGTPHRAGRLGLTSTGLVAYSNRGIPQWNVQTQGRGPHTLEVTDAGSVQLRGATGVLWESPKDPEPGITPEAPRVLGQVVNGRLVFGSREGTRFSLDTRPGARCNLVDVAKQCGATCPGLLFSQADQTWQPLSSEAGDYRMADTQQFVVPKTAFVDLQDGSCPSGAADVVTDFGTPTGVLQRGGKRQCGPPTGAQALPRAYAAANDAATAAEASLTEAVEKTTPKLKELRGAVRAKPDPTPAAQAEDWSVVNAQFKSQAILWSVIAGVGVLVAIMLARRK
jgi:hypothetical protein